MKIKKILVTFFALGTFYSINAQTWSGGTLQFPAVNNGVNADGLTWLSTNPLQYGIYKTPGTWTSPNFQQLKLSWTTGIIIDGGYSSIYTYTGTQIQPNGGPVFIGAKSNSITPTLLSIYGNTTIGTTTAKNTLTVNGAVKIGTQTQNGTSLLSINGDAFATSLSTTGTVKSQSIINSGDATIGTSGSSNILTLNGTLTQSNGKVTLGTKVNPSIVLINTAIQDGSSALTVNGKISATEIEVKDIAADFVFENNYKLSSLKEIESYINTNKHLPGIAPASETVKGVNLGEFNQSLLQKVEELTLYLIAQQKQIEKLNALLKESK